MTWTRAELSRLLLEYGGTACDAFVPLDGERHQTLCANCREFYSAHLAKSAAEEIGVLEAKANRYRGALEDITTADETSTLDGAVAIAREGLC